MRDLPLVGDDFAGYRLLAVLGRGGMSTVYRAGNPRLGNVIALKVIAAELADDDVFRARFLEESRIAAGLNHPNVVPIHDSGSSDGLLYIAMRHVMGTDLRQMISRRGRLPAQTAVYLLSQAARALDVAHRRGLVHRDVKPGNLLVEQASDDADPDHVYLTDFGITKHGAERTGLTATGQFIGTVDYIAPEQIRGLPTGGLADQYSLGCVLYECLTGRVPFERDLEAAIIWAHVEEAPPRPTALRPDLPPAVDDVFARVLAKQPGQRYANCREFMAAARDALGSLATPPAGYLAGPEAAYQAAAWYAWGHPAEIAHESSGGYEATGDVAGLVDRTRIDAPGWPGGGQRLAGPGGASGLLAAPVGNTGPGGAAPAGGTAPSELPPGYPPVGRRRPPRGPRRHGPWRPSRWLVIYTAVVLAAAAGLGVGLATLASGGATRVTLSSNGAGASPGIGTGKAPGAAAGSGTGGASGSGSAGASSGATASAGSGSGMGVQVGSGQSGPATLAGVLAAANNSVEGKGLLPPGGCGQYRQNPGGAIVCNAPVPGVAEVFYQNYASLGALYDAYQTQVKQLDGGTFKQNTGTCGNSAVPYAEFGWNQEEGHPHGYTVAQMAAGKVGQIYAAGRMACFSHRTPHGVTQDIVWTIGNGPAMGVAIGDGSPRPVYQLWASLHHAVLFRGTEMCGTADRMNFRDIPTGNLKVVPVCPPGVAALPAASPG